MGSKFGKQYPVFASRNDKERLLFVAAAGLALSLLVITLLVLNFKPTADARELATNESVQAPLVGTVSLLAPERLISAGRKLSEMRFKEVFWPRNQVPEEAIRDISEVQEMYAKVDLQPGLPITRSSLTSEPMSMQLPLTPGMRAVSIEVDATAGLEGHALPGTKVDVVLTFHEDQKLTSKVIVQNARVLSYGGDATVPAKRGPVDKLVGTPGKTLTLEVSTEDALKVQTARQMGRLSLIMRAPEDEKTLVKTEMDQNQVGGGEAKGSRVKSNGSDCNRGKMKMAGKEYMIMCDGRIVELNQDEP